MMHYHNRRMECRRHLRQAYENCDDPHLKPLLKALKDHPISGHLSSDDLHDMAEEVEKHSRDIVDELRQGAEALQCH